MVSISIVNWNTKDLLRKCLNSIYENSFRDFEVFVVDNNSSDGSVQMVKEQFPQVNLLANTENLGFAKANNQAIRQSRGKYILILNPDIILFKDTLGQMISFMEENPQAGIMGIKLNNDNTKTGYFRKYPSIIQVLLFYTMLDKLSLKNKWLKDRYWESIDTPSVIEIPQVPGACLLMRKEIGLFDEDFNLFFEDVDLCYRIKKAGWKIFYVPYIKAIHKGAQSISMLPYTELADRFFTSMHLYFKKHHSFIKAETARLIIILNTLLKIAVMTFLYCLSDYKRDRRREHIQMLWKFLKCQL